MVKGRDSNGRFAPGNPGGPGNPYARQTAAMRSALLGAVTENDLRKVATALVTRAKEGDTTAAKLLFSYVVGRPDDPINPDTLDIEESTLNDKRFISSLLSPLD